jgi:hypothetical protein
LGDRCRAGKMTASINVNFDQSVKGESMEENTFVRGSIIERIRHSFINQDSSTPCDAADRCYKLRTER